MPFINSIDLGIIKNADSYSVVDANGRNEIGKLPVAIAKSDAPDESPYAQITDADIRFLRGEKTPSIVLYGKNFSSFTDLSEKNVKIDYEKNVVVIRPEVQVRAGVSSNSVPTESPLYIEKRLEKPVTGLFLLHVRSMNGQAIHKMVKIQ
jgi:hypothetical protein